MEKLFKVLMVALAVAAALCLAGCKNAEEDSGGVSTPTPTGNYLTFKGDADFTLGISTDVSGSIKAWNSTVEYFAGDGTWQVWDGATAIPSVANCVYLRGKGNTHFATSSSNQTVFALAGNASAVECNGNIMTLLDYDNPDGAAMDNYCFCGLFQNCAKLTKAPALPATTLKDSCYRSMFYQCTALTSVGKIADGNAVTTVNACFKYMFSGCSNLNVNDTGAGTLFVNIGTISGNDDVTSMFAGCKGSPTPTDGKKYYYN